MTNTVNSRLAHLGEILAQSAGDKAEPRWLLDRQHIKEAILSGITLEALSTREDLAESVMIKVNEVLDRAYRDWETIVSASSVSSVDKTITIECGDHHTKDRILDAVTGEIMIAGIYRSRPLDHALDVLEEIADASSWNDGKGGTVELPASVRSFAGKTITTIVEFVKDEGIER